MSEPMVAYYEPMVGYESGSFRCCLTRDGIRRLWSGSSHKTPRAAIAHRQNLDPYISPSRVSGDELTPGAGSLSRDQVRVGSSPEPRERLSAPARTPR